MAPSLVALVTALTAFCGFAYQQILAIALSDTLGNMTLAQASSLSVFLIGMGLGSAGQNKVTRPLARLFWIEALLALAGATSIAYLTLTEIFLRFWDLPQAGIQLAAVVPMIGLIGFLTGAELPILLRIYQKKPGWLIAVQYAGAFIAAWIVPLVLLPQLDVLGSALLVAAVNLLVNGILLTRLPMGWSLPTLATGLLLILLWPTQIQIRDLHLKMIYYTPKAAHSANWREARNILDRLESPIRIRSDHQWIDILPATFTTALDGKKDFKLFLNRRLQVAESRSARYHQSFAHGAIQFHTNVPKKVLILGGGDGILAMELLRHPEIKSIDLVEIDQKIIDLARHYPSLTRLNKNSLADKRVHVHIEDAIRFLNSQNQYDLILIDFPFPNGLELSPLYSKEFYTQVKNSLLPDGKIVLDFPSTRSDDPNWQVLTSTLHAAGFEHVIGYGHDDKFIAASAKPLTWPKRIHSPNLDNQTWLNLTQIRSEDLPPKSRINKITTPYSFAQPSPNQNHRQAHHAQFDLETLASIWPQLGPRFSKVWGQLTDSSPIVDWSKPPQSTQSKWPQDFPSYQWGIHTEGNSVTSFIQIMDSTSSQAIQLARHWSNKFRQPPPDNWVGLSLTADFNFAEFYLQKGDSLNVQTCKHGICSASVPVTLDKDRLIAKTDGQTLWTQTSVETTPVWFSSQKAQAIQTEIQKQFLLLPSSIRRSTDGSWLRAYYP
ncbi:MAG: spermidine synthase [Bdellovibrionales bacterium]